MKKSAFSPLVLEHIKACRLVRTSSANLREKTGFTGSQCALICAVANKPGAAQVEHKDATGIDRSTMSDVVKRLVKKGLLGRLRCKKDGRKWQVKLTAAGERVHAKILNAV